jgi:hypothetical protein
MSTFRWFGWTPRRHSMEGAFHSPPTEPTKFSSGSFVSAGPEVLHETVKPTTTPTDILRGQKYKPRGESSFPHCPRCASYALYRKNNVGTYECQTCQLREIDDTVARRIQ